MPSLRHELLSWAVPRLRGSGELDTEAAERARVERWHTGLDPALPGGRWAGLGRHTAGRGKMGSARGAPFPVHTLTPHGVPAATRTTVYYVHGGGFVAPADPVHVRYALRLARLLGARAVLPDYPLAPEHTWAGSHDVLADDLARRLDSGERVVLAGDSAGGGLALALALTLRDRGGAQPDRLLLLSPWVDLTTSTPDTQALDVVDPWLSLSKLRAYAGWWAGSPSDLGRPEVSPALGDLHGLPPTLMICGTRDLLVAGCRLLVDRAAATPGGWDLTYLEAPDLIHVFPLLPLLPEAVAAWRHTVAWLEAPR